MKWLLYLEWANVLNIVALTSSIFLLLHLIVAAFADQGERPEAIGFYLIWNFTTTFWWVSEVSLRSYRHATTTRSTAPPAAPSAATTTTTMSAMLPVAALILEWSLAVYFTVDSLKLLYEWKTSENRVEKLEEDMLDVVLNTIGYSYITFVTLRDYIGEQRRQQGQENTVSNGPYQAVPDASESQSSATFA